MTVKKYDNDHVERDKLLTKSKERMNMLNERNLLVKEMIKAEVFSENEKYEKMYSNMIKKDGSLRVKLYNVSRNIEVMKKIKAKVEALALGEVDIVKSYHDGGNSIVVYVKAENIV